MTPGPAVWCPLCNGGPTEEVYRQRDAPVACATVFDTAAEARAVPRGEVHLHACPLCGFVFNAAFDASLAEAGAAYEASQAASPHFGAFARELARDWVDRHRLAGRPVLEVGSGHGDFLAELVRAGAWPALGVDPIADARRLPPDVHGRAALRPERFEAGCAALPGDALVCRHTLEHVGNVPAFLAAVAEWAAHDRARVVLFEVPASERVFEETAFWDVFYEHGSYFVEATARDAFARAGLAVERTAHVFGGQYLLVEARAGHATRPPPRGPGWLEAARAFGERSRAAISRCRAHLAALRAEGPPLVLWQGAAKTIGLVAALGDPDAVDLAVDLAPGRHGKFLPPFGLPVHPPEALADLRPRHVVLMNPVYRSEVAAALARLSPDTTLHTIDALLGD